MMFNTTHFGVSMLPKHPVYTPCVLHDIHILLICGKTKSGKKEK